jgi:hypothetical protein
MVCFKTQFVAGSMMLFSTTTASNDIAGLVSDFAEYMNQGWLDAFTDCVSDDDTKRCFSDACTDFITGYDDLMQKRNLDKYRSINQHEPEEVVKRLAKDMDLPEIWEDIDEVDYKKVKVFCKKVKPLTHVAGPSARADDVLSKIGNLYDYGIRLGKGVVDAALDTGSCAALLANYSVNSNKRKMRQALDANTYKLWLFCAGHESTRPSSKRVKRSLFCSASRRFEKSDLDITSLADCMKSKGRSIMKDLGLTIGDITAMIEDDEYEIECGKDEL